MIEIIGTQIEECAMIGMLLGAIVGAAMLSSTLYIVARIKHRTEILDAENDAKLKGEDYPSYKIEKVKVWFRGYTLALAECAAMSFLIGAGAAIFGVHLGYISGAVEMGAVAIAAAILGGMIVDKKVIHPIANNKFVEEVETPLIEKFLHPDIAAQEDPVNEEALEINDPDVVKVVEAILKKKRII